MSSDDPNALTTTQAIAQDLRFFFPSSALGTQVKTAIENMAPMLNELDYSASDDVYSVIICDTDINIRAISRSFSRYVGHPQVAMIGRNPGVMQGEMTTEKSRGEFRKLIKKRKEGTVSIINYTSKGVPFLHRVTIAPLYDVKQNLISFIGVQHSKEMVPA